MDSVDKQTNLKNMDMRFGTWNVRSMYRVGLLRTVAEDISNISYMWSEYRRSDGTEVALNQQANIL
jgi:hypothetical protein